MWHEDNDNLMRAIQEQDKAGACFPMKCPICAAQGVHLYFHRFPTGITRQGGVWAWCSSCQCSTHLSGLMPAWWENPPEIDFNKLSSQPDYLELHKSAIDDWVNGLRFGGDGRQRHSLTE